MTRSGATYKYRHVLEAVGVHAIFGNAWLVLKDERDLNHTGQTSSHQSVAKHIVGHGASHQVLRVCRHGPSRHKEHEAGYEVALGRAVSVPAQPDACQTSSEPYDPHGCVLPVILDPSCAPTVYQQFMSACIFCVDVRAVWEKTYVL